MAVLFSLILSGTMFYLGVAQLEERVIWDHEAVSSILATQTKRLMNIDKSLY